MKNKSKQPIVCRYASQLCLTSDYSTVAVLLLYTVITQPVFKVVIVLTRILSLRCGYLNSQVAILMQLLEEADIPDPSAGI